jgi:ACS family hexuronate transporter-like MFS transporter
MLSDIVVRRGLTPQRARMTVLASVACVAPIGALAGIAPSVVTAMAVTCLVACLTQCWATNTATLVAEVVPNSAAATVMGLMGTAGSLAGACFAQVLGYVIQSFGYPAAFALAAILHPCAAVVLFVMLRSTTSDVGVHKFGSLKEDST